MSEIFDNNKITYKNCCQKIYEACQKFLKGPIFKSFETMAIFLKFSKYILVYIMHINLDAH